MNCLQTSYRELSSCHEKNEKKRCPFCGSLRTKRKGFVKSLFKTKRGRVPKKTQRYFCNECGKNFSSNLPGKRKRASDDLKAAAVNDYVTTKCSLSEVGKRFGVHASTVHRWLIEKADNAKSFGKAVGNADGCFAAQRLRKKLTACMLSLRNPVRQTGSLAEGRQRRQASCSTRSATRHRRSLAPCNPAIQTESHCGGP